MTERSPEAEALAWAMCAANQGGGPGRCDLDHCVCGGDAAAVIVALRMSGWALRRDHGEESREEKRK